MEFKEENLYCDTDITKIKLSFVKLIQTKKQFELKIPQDSYERKLNSSYTTICQIPMVVKFHTLYLDKSVKLPSPHVYLHSHQNINLHSNRERNSSCLIIFHKQYIIKSGIVFTKSVLYRILFFSCPPLKKNLMNFMLETASNRGVNLGAVSKNVFEQK